MDEQKIYDTFDTWCKKLRVTPNWDVKLELVTDKNWSKTGDFKIDCTDKKAVFMLNIASPKQENIEEIIVSNIKWDTDGEDVDLPKRVIVNVTIDNADLLEDINGYADNLSDYLSDTYGFCHEGFKVKWK